MSDLAYLATKCAFAVVVMIAVHYVSKTPSYFLSALALSFPALSMVAYYFMYHERGAADVRTTTAFGLCSAIPFISFLAALNWAVKSSGIAASLAMAFGVWLLLSVALVFIWYRVH